MIRTQVFLPEQTYRLIRLQALREKKPAAQVIRDALEIGMEQKTQQKTGKNIWTELAALNIKGPRDLSKNIDKYLYEE